ncbi:hypothetical protein, partial [Salmonella enterica]|uniref:hypothetical protein n=1 Tax=Salmonella enterica TaxID=28901 RepID=UPI001C64A350
QTCALVGLVSAALPVIKPRLNVRQRKDPAIPPHSRLFSLQFRPVILYSERMLYLPLGPGRQI